MTRSEAEEIFISILLKDEPSAVEMTAKDAQLFRIFIGKMIKEMEMRNRGLWLKAREFNVTYEEPFMMMRKRKGSKYTILKIEEKGEEK
jgi:hypothetical protein